DAARRVDQGVRRRPRPDHDSRRRAHHAPSGGDRHGCGGTSGIRATQHRHGPRGHAALSTAAGAGHKASGDSWLIYRRLLKYAKPHLGVFMIGVLGAALFAASNASVVYLIKEFLHGAFVSPDPRIVWLVPTGVVVLFTLRGIGDYVQT